MSVTTVQAADLAPTATGLRPVRIWLALSVFLVFVMVIVGGATRLTDSGLSITEWKPIHGAIPPLTASAWDEEFALYQQTPQYQLMNRGMTLGEFKFIFWWEWGHRQLGRFIGLFYLAGFVWFAATRRFSFRTGAVLFGMGLLLATQGLVGWIMVVSGLQPGMTAVAPVKLTLHLTLACLFFASLVVAYARLGGAAREPAAPALRWSAIGLVVLAFVQIALGGLVAGHDAGMTYNTWPLMDGRFVPDGLATLRPLGMNFIDNITTIQFNHRIGAYVLSALVLAYFLAALGTGAPAIRSRALLMVLLTAAQVVLGILTLIHVVPLGLALAHQAVALLLLGVMLWNAAAMEPAAR